MFIYVAQCSSAYELWLTLDNYFIVESKMRGLSLKNMLQTLKKSNLTIHEYFRKIKNATNALITSAQSKFEGELIALLLGGTRLEFDLIVVHVVETWTKVV